MCRARLEAFNFYAGDGFDLAVERALKDAGDAELNYLQEGIRLGRAWFNEVPAVSRKTVS